MASQPDGVNGPVDANLWFDKLPDSDLQDIATPTVATASDTYPFTPRIGINDVAYFAFYYKHSNTTWYVNQNGAKVICNIEETDPAASPAPCASSPIYISAPGKRICQKIVPEPPLTGPHSGANGLIRKDLQTLFWTCADSSCDGAKAKFSSAQADNSPRRSGQGRSMCYSSWIVGEQADQASINPTWGFSHKRGYDTSSVNNLLNDYTIYIWVMGLDMTEEELK